MKIVRAIAHITADRFTPDDVPVIVDGALADWPALARWSPAYLADRIGNAAIRFKVSTTGAHPDLHQATLDKMFATEAGTMRDYLAQLDASGRRLFTGDEKFVLRRRDGVTTIDPDLAPLLDDVSVPRWAADRLYTVWSWFSGAGVRTWLHYDNNACHNLNAQITGAKTCVLIDPSQLDKVALFPIGGANPALNCSQIDVTAPDLARFPAFAEVEAIGGRLEAGELLYIPAWWLHAFEHVGGFNSNINFWWLPEQPVDNAVARHQAAIIAARS
jgi:lysine-specific demethylase 8